jgi:uncharacterized membrane protein
MIDVTLYSRADCHLCDQARADLEALQAAIPHRLAVVDVDSNHELKNTYGLEVPVVEVGPYRLKAPFSQQELRMTLGAANDREKHIDAIERVATQDLVQSGARWTGADNFSYWLSRHYLGLFNFFILLYVGLPFLAPALMAAGIEGPAGLIYRSYGVVCHQLAYRSFFLFGEQPFYPRQSAGVQGILPFGQATGLSEDSDAASLFAARDFIGDPSLGYKVALCERDVAIYGAILLFGLLYAATGRRLPALPWYLWILIGLLPIAIDGVSQLISQPPFNLIPYRESTPFYRALTGALFGFATAWFGYPIVEQTMLETRQIMGNKYRRLNTAGK